MRQRAVSAIAKQHRKAKQQHQQAQNKGGGEWGSKEVGLDEKRVFAERTMMGKVEECGVHSLILVCHVVRGCKQEPAERQ